MRVFEGGPNARDAVARYLRPLPPTPLHRSRRSQGRRPYEPSMRRDARRLPRGWAGAGKTVREAGGALKGPGNFGAAIATAVSSLSQMGRWRGGEADETEGFLRVRVR